MKGYLVFAGRWLRHLTLDAWKGWAAAAPVVMAGGLILFWPIEPAFRWLGGGLQVVGFGITIGEIVGIQRLFNADGFFGSVWRHWQVRPRLRRRIAMAAGSGSFALVGAAGQLRVGRNSNATPDERLSRLEAEIDQLQTRVEADRAENREAHSGIEKELRDKAAQIRAELVTLESTVREASVGSLSLRRLGVWYFVVGIGLASTSLELCKIFGTCSP